MDFWKHWVWKHLLHSLSLIQELLSKVCESKSFHLLSVEFIYSATNGSWTYAMGSVHLPTAKRIKHQWCIIRLVHRLYKAWYMLWQFIKQSTYPFIKKYCWHWARKKGTLNHEMFSTLFMNGPSGPRREPLAPIDDDGGSGDQRWGDFQSSNHSS